MPNELTTQQSAMESNLMATAAQPRQLQPINQEDIKQAVSDYLASKTYKLTDAERTQFVALCITQGLNPIKREVYAVKYGNTFNILTGYEVYLKRAEQSEQWNGYKTDVQRRTNPFTDEDEMVAICAVSRKDMEHPIIEEVWYSEYKQDTAIWKSKPITMLRKCAIATAFRRAFPTAFIGMPYTTDEMPSESSQEPAQQAKPASQQKQAHGLSKEVLNAARSKATGIAMDCKTFDEFITKLTQKTNGQITADARTLAEEIYNDAQSPISQEPAPAPAQPVQEESKPAQPAPSETNNNQGE